MKAAPHVSLQLPRFVTQSSLQIARFVPPLPTITTET